MNRILALSVFVLAAACGPRPAPPPPAPTATPAAAAAPSPANAADRHREVHWVRTAAEYRALVEQTYRTAADAVRAHAEERPTGTWAVIMDADETVLDNSEFERRIAETGEAFEEHMWSSWVREEAAEAVPGASLFIRQVQELGGRVAIVTNRDAELCPATRRNLEALGIRPAVVLCETDTGEKEPRFRMVQEGTTEAGLPPLEVVLWIGDNIGDFPGLTQAVREEAAEAFEGFGRRYFVLPNPMYGSWMGNEWR